MSHNDIDSVVTFLSENEISVGGPKEAVVCNELLPWLQVDDFMFHGNFRSVTPL
jgi:hypothetical protein